MNKTKEIFEELRRRDLTIQIDTRIFDEWSDYVEGLLVVIKSNSMQKFDNIKKRFFEADPDSAKYFVSTFANEIGGKLSDVVDGDTIYINREK